MTRYGLAGRIDGIRAGKYDNDDWTPRGTATVDFSEISECYDQSRLHGMRRLDPMNEVDELLKLDVKDLPALKPLAPGRPPPEGPQKPLSGARAPGPSSTCSRRLIPSCTRRPTRPSPSWSRERRRSSIISRSSSSRTWPCTPFSSSQQLLHRAEQLTSCWPACGRRTPRGGATRSSSIPMPPGAPDPLRGQDLHRPGFHRPLQFQAEILRRPGTTSFLSRTSTIKLLERADDELKKPLDYKSFFQEIRESVNELDTESRPS